MNTHASITLKHARPRTLFALVSTIATVAVLTLSGCASTRDMPREQMAVARAAVDRAAGPAGADRTRKSLSPETIRSARAASAAARTLSSSASRQVRAIVNAVTFSHNARYCAHKLSGVIPAAAMRDVNFGIVSLSANSSARKGFAQIVTA